jgi:hypothetical protein
MPERISRSVHRPFIVMARFPACVLEVATIILITLLAVVAQVLWLMLVVPVSAILMLILIACDKIDTDALPWLPRQLETIKREVVLPMHARNDFVESLEKRMAKYVESQASIW